MITIKIGLKKPKKDQGITLISLLQNYSFFLLWANFIERDREPAVG